MDQNRTPDNVLILLAVRLVQPGMLSDIFSGAVRLSPPDMLINFDKEGVKTALESLIDIGLVDHYATRRYILSPSGENYIAGSGIRAKIDGRRMYLLKETRRNSF